MLAADSRLATVAEMLEVPKQWQETGPESSQYQEGMA